MQVELFRKIVHPKICFKAIEQQYLGGKKHCFFSTFLHLFLLIECSWLFFARYFCGYTVEVLWCYKTCVCIVFTVDLNASMVTSLPKVLKITMTSQLENYANVHHVTCFFCCSVIVLECFLTADWLQYSACTHNYVCSILAQLVLFSIQSSLLHVTQSPHYLMYN